MEMAVIGVRTRVCACVWDGSTKDKWAPKIGYILHGRDHSSLASRLPTFPVTLWDIHMVKPTTDLVCEMWYFSLKVSIRQRDTQQSIMKL